MPSPLDFLHRNNNQNEWAKRYVGNKMGIQQMQKGGSPEDSYKVDPDYDYLYQSTQKLGETPKEDKWYKDWIDIVAKENPKFLKGLDEPIDRWKFFDMYNKATESGEFPPDSLFNVHNPDFISPNPMFHPDTLEKIRLEREEANGPEGYQHGGAVFESAPADETAHDQMNNLIFENEMKQSQGASPLSFLNRDRIDSQNQAIMDAVMSMSVPAAGALSMGKSAFGKLADFPKSRVLSQIPVNKEIQKVNWNRMVRDRLPKSADKALQNIKDLSWLEDLIKRNQ